MSSRPSLRHPKFVLFAVVVVAATVWVRATSAVPHPRRWGVIQGLGLSGSRRAPERVMRPVGSAHKVDDRALMFDGPQERFRDNLVDGRAYITSGHSFGSSNQMVTHIKMIALALRLDRIPIVDNLYGGEHGEGSEIPLSDFYDLARLSKTISLPIVEWQDVKRTDSGASETLVCWQDFRNSDVASSSFNPYKIKTVYWHVPKFTYDSDGDVATLASLETLAFKKLDPNGDGGPLFDGLRESMQSLNRGIPVTLPDQQLLCFDQFFWVLDGTFVNGELASESIEEPSPLGRSWQEVGQHLHYTQDFADLRDEFVASLLGAPGQAYIGVHLRQGDFVEYGRMGSKIEAPFVEGVEAVREELAVKDWAARAGKWADRLRKPLPVVFATDSDDKEYIASLEARGWHYLDHEAFGTVERYGGWYPSMLDQAVLSNAAGFVGTSGSSFSALARNRVISWQDGPTRMTGRG